MVGAGGRMGSLAARVVEQTDGFELVARIGRDDELSLMLDADVVVDFTLPSVSPGVVEYAVEHDVPALVGTSGWSEDRIARVRSLAEAHPETGVLFVPNFSIGSVLATSFAAAAAKFFDSIEIVEGHHAAKVDSPSGTAVRTAELMGKARAQVGPVAAPHTDQRARGQLVSGIPVHSLRLQGVVARQEVIFGGAGEVLTIAHDTISGDAYTAGLRLGLRAAVQLRGVAVGLDRLIDLDLAGS